MLKFIYKEDYASIDVEGETWPTTRLGALFASLAKWQFLHATVVKEEFDVGAGGHSTCALCHLYWLDYGEKENCLECPVFVHTNGEGECQNTPFVEYEVQMDEGDDDVDALLGIIDAGIELLQKLISEEKGE